MKNKSTFIKFFAFAMIFSLIASTTSGLSGQDKKGSKKKKEIEIPEPEEIKITTKDGVDLDVVWYESTKGKKSPCAILVHDYGRSGRDFTGDGGLAAAMQKKGFAVIVPDLRGHGGSTKQTGRDKDLDAKSFRKSDFLKMLEDIESCKRFLVKKNNEGKLNIELLTVVAVGKHSAIAVDWAIRDWSFGLNSRGIKQGKDVKALLLLSSRENI